MVDGQAVTYIAVHPGRVYADTGARWTGLFRLFSSLAVWKGLRTKAQKRGWTSEDDVRLWELRFDPNDLTSNALQVTSEVKL